MRVGIDLRPLQTGSARGGVGSYARQLARALRRGRGAGDEIVGFVSAGRPAGIGPEEADRIVAVPGPSRAITLFDPLRMAGLLRREGIDLFHSVFYAPPVRPPRGVKVVQTVHDLTPLLFPDGFSMRQRLVFRTTFALAAHVDRVVAVSDNTRRDLDRLASIPPCRVEVIPPGVDPAFDESVDRDEARRRLRSRGILGPFLLHVGGYDEVKNLPVLLAAAARLRRDGLPHRLVVAGDPGRRAGAFLREVEGFGLQGEVVQTGWVPQADLALLYRAADVLLYPSRYEGFGLPPLEAMACGTPVVAAAAGSLPEVLGGACPLVDPRDPGALAAEARRLVEDPGARGEAVRRGRERAARYRWETSADRTWDLYRRLAGGDGA
jgi:glycosyltransferase involved in cell wall biosynthesis